MRSLPLNKTFCTCGHLSSKHNLPTNKSFSYGVRPNVCLGAMKDKEGYTALCPCQCYLQDNLAYLEWCYNEQQLNK